LRLTHLILKDATLGVIMHALEVLVHVQVLTLRQCCDVRWHLLNGLQQLRELQLSHCNITDAELAQVLSNDRLEVLHLNNCSKLSSVAMEHIGNSLRLRKLEYCRIFHDSRGTLKHLGNLKNLTHLKIGGEIGGGDWLRHICRCLVQLKELTLTSCTAITDESFAEISSLTRLSKLALQYCPNLTSKCFEHIVLLPALHFIVFDATLCVEGGFENIAVLNNMACLKEIDVNSKAEDLAGILKCLCRARSWRLRYEPTEAARSRRIVDHYLLSSY